MSVRLPWNHRYGSDTCSVILYVHGKGILSFTESLFWYSSAILFLRRKFRTKFCDFFIYQNAPYIEVYLNPLGVWYVRDLLYSLKTENTSFTIWTGVMVLRLLFHKRSKEEKYHQQEHRDCNDVEVNNRAAFHIRFSIFWSVVLTFWCVVSESGITHDDGERHLSVTHCSFRVVPWSIAFLRSAPCPSWEPLWFLMMSGGSDSAVHLKSHDTWHADIVLARLNCHSLHVELGMPSQYTSDVELA